MKILFIFAALCILSLSSIYYFTTMPGKSYHGPFLPLSSAETKLKSLLYQHVQYLAEEIGQRHVGQPENLAKSANYIKTTLMQLGYKPQIQSFFVDKVPCENIIVEIKGTHLPEEILIVGAHYDTAPPDSLGANDNASGVAAMLAMAQDFATQKSERTLRFVFFVNEESPFYSTNNMGSLRYAKEIKSKKEDVVAMLCLETIGYYSDKPHSQYYPFPLAWFYPNQGNFIGFIGNLSSRDIVANAIKIFRETTKFPSEGASLPTMIQGVSWSDHASFWEEGYKAIMITDTAFYRYPYYHTGQDSVDKIDFDKLARVVFGVEQVILRFVNEKDYNNIG